MRISKLSPGRRADTNMVGTQSRRDTAAPRHPTRPRSTGPATARPGTACPPWRPCTALHSRASTRPIADNLGTANTQWQTTAAPTHTSLLPWVPGRRSTQSTRVISPEPLRPKIPDLPHAAGRRAHRGAPSSSTREEVHAPALENGVDDDLATVRLAHEVDLVGPGCWDVMPSTNRGDWSGWPSRGRRRELSAACSCHARQARSLQSGP